MKSPTRLSIIACLANLSLARHIPASPRPCNDSVALHLPPNAVGASIPHSNSYSSFSIEPAFWVEFFGNLSSPNTLTFDLLARIVEHGGNPIIRPGGITMDSMIFDASAQGVVRSLSPTGGVYRTTVGPEYYQSWDLFPASTKFVSTLNFGNNSLEIAEGLAVASVEYQSKRVLYFELGNEPTNYPAARWNDSTAAYVQQWKNWTHQIDLVVNQTSNGTAAFPSRRWFASSATTDESGLNVRPADLIPAGIDSAGQVAEYSIHSYQFATCDPARAALATIPNILNHTLLTSYADTEIMPSANAALASGVPWVIGEFNSIACSGNPNVSDTFAQALWTLDMQLIYAVRNASAVHLHQGATLVFQSSNQVNTAGNNGEPGFSTYDFAYPETTSKRGEKRSLPGYLALLFMAEALAVNGTRVQEVALPNEVDAESFVAYAFYVGDRLSKLALVNLAPYYANSTSDSTVSLDISHHSHAHRGWAKRMTSPFVDEKDSAKATWAGQSFENGTASGGLNIEEVGQGSVVRVRGSEALLVFFDQDEVYGL